MRRHASPKRSDRLPITFVILCLGRTGSTHLQSLLDSHPDIRCFGELFTGNAHTFDEVFLASPHDDPAAYLEELTRPVEARAVGFKLPVNSIRAHPQVVEAVTDPKLQIIRLFRSNLLALLVSRRLLAATGVPQSTHGSYGDVRVRLEPRILPRTFERMEAHERWLDELAGGRSTFRLAYEDLIEGRGIDDLQRFLGVETRPLRSWFEKLRNLPLSDAVENWGEVAQALSGTRFEHFLTDGP